jgi:hypothetical protein
MKFKSDVDVEAALAVSGGVTVTDSATGVNIDSSGHASLRLDRGSTSYDNNIMFSTAGDTKFRIWQDGNADYLYIRDDDNGTNMVTFKKGGNVGIGTTSPGNKLTVSADAGGSAISYFNNTNAAGYGILINTPDSNNARYALRVNTGVGTPFYVGNGGNVGIGTASPGARLHVEKDSTSEPLALFKTTAGDASVRIEGAGGESYLEIANSAISGSTTNSWGIGMNDNTSLSFGWGTNSTLNKSTYLTMLNGGNVGIGTTSPSSTLTVNGEIEILKDDVVSTLEGGHLTLRAGSSKSYRYNLNFCGDDQR